MTPQPKVWVCPNCGNTVTTLIPVTIPPTCSRHTGGGRQMKETTDEPND